MKTLKYLILFLISVICVSSCTKDDDNKMGGDPQRPETPVEVETLPDGVEVGEQTIQLNNIQLDNVIAVDEENSTLTFSSFIPQEYIPQMNDIILQFSPTEELPYGFLGKVSNIMKSGDKIIVETDVPALSEAFDKLEIDYDMSDVAVRTRSEFATEDRIDFDEDHFLRYTRKLSLDEPNVSCEVGLGVRISTSTYIDKEKNIDNQEYEIGLKADAELKYEYELEGEKSITRDLGKGFNFRLPYASPAIMGNVQFSWISEASGKFNFSNTVKASVCRFYGVNKIGNNISTSERIGVTDSSMKVGFEPELKFEGEMFSGLGVNIELRLFGRKELTIGVGSKIGPQVSTEVDLLVDKDNLYEQYNDTAVELKGVVQSTAFAQAKLFNIEAEWSKPFGDGWVFWDATRYIFPSFKNPKIVRVGNRADCSVELDRNILFKGEVGIGQYKGEEVVSHSEPIEYYNSEDFQNPLTANFDHMDSLSYYTYLKWGDKYIKCKNLQSIVGKWKGVDYLGTCYDAIEDVWWVINDFYKRPWEWEVFEDGTAICRWYDLKGEWENPDIMQWDIDESTNKLTLKLMSDNYDYGEVYHILEMTNDKLVLESKHVEGWEEDPPCECGGVFNIILKRVEAF